MSNESKNQNEIDWASLPNWANYHSVDVDGEVTIWEFKPKRVSDCFALVKGRSESIDYRFEMDVNGDYPNWKKSLVERPIDASTNPPQHQSTPKR